MKKVAIIFLLIINYSAFCQFKAPKFGKIEIGDLQMSKYEKDTTAEALIMFDSGKSEIDLSPEYNFIIKYERHYRVKILEKSALNLGNIEIKLYKSNTGEEKLLNLEAVTYNIENGKIIKTKLDEKTIFDEESRNYIIKKFALPNLREGSIFEIKYSINSEFLYNMPSWNFQYEYPAIWSQYEYTIPEYFEYKTTKKGFLPYDIDVKEQFSKTFTISSGFTPPTSNGLGYTNNPTSYNNLNTINNIYTLALKDVPAFKSEPYIDCKENYIQSINLELKSIQYPNSPKQEFAQNWSSINQILNEDEYFGNRLRFDSFIKDTVKSLCQNKLSELEKAEVIYSYIQNNLKWNGKYALTAKEMLKKPFNERTGNSAELNLLLTLMLRAAKLNANPVIYSTRDNGSAENYSPSITNYNSVLCELKINNTKYLLNAICKNCPFGTLEANDINGKGHVINDSTGEIVSLTTKTTYKEIKKYTLTINSNGEFSGTINNIYDGYSGIMVRDYLQKKSTKEIIKDIEDNYSGITVKDINISNLNDIELPLKDSSTVDIIGKSEIINGKILFKPLLFEGMYKNKFSLLDRKYPVDYNYPILENYVFEYTIPENYVIESIPQKLSVKLPDNSISVIYNVQSLGNKIYVIYKRNINRITYQPEEYKNLIAIYDMIVKSSNEYIILKPIN